MSDEREAVDDDGTPAPTPALPDFYMDPNAVIGDVDAVWRFGKRPDYAKTRLFYAESRKADHAAGSLPDLVENLVKNWEIEASFKTRLSDWRTINHDRYTFSMNGGASSKVDYMLEQGTYNAILPSNEYYCPEHNDISLSHKTFKRMMPTFAWEVIEVYSGPPKVGFRWRHWGWMKSDYSALNSHGEKVTAKAHGSLIDIEGVTVADLDANMKIVHLETWFDPQRLFGQIAPNGVTKVPGATTSNTNLGMEDDSAKREYGTHPEDPKPESPLPLASGSASRQVSRETFDRSVSPLGHDGPSFTGEPRDCPFLKFSSEG